jgi:ribosomal peptide maturation radical SAM protein 1
MGRVLLVNMPLANLRWPNLGLGLLQAALTRRGIACDAAYLNFDFAERLGLDDYTWIADHFAFVLGGERLFAKHYFDNALPDDDSFWRDVLLPADPRLSEQDRRDYQRIATHVGPFLDDCMAAVDWPRYDVVGFTTSFQQTMPSLCLARRIKKEWPETKILFGGAACAAEMGIELLRQFVEIDYVFLGEADLSIGPVVEQILAGRGSGCQPAQVSWRAPGVSPEMVRTRADAVPGLTPGARQDALVRDLDALPYPDFDAYFTRLARSPLRAGIDPLLFFESSRGCWWGEKHHCAFCGLNGAELGFRSKLPQRVLDELRYLVARHNVHRANSADNILDHRYFQTLLPLLRDAGLDLQFVYEMKTNLTRGQVEALLAAGLGAAQLGIETFSTPLLKLIGKGATAMHNLQALKWFSEAGIEVKWNLLYGFPGEDPAEYAALGELLPALCHLAPPMAVGRVRLDRFSPYFENPTAHGMTNVRPNRAFRYVYPFPPEVLGRLAYYHEFDYADGRDPLSYARPLIAAGETWQQLGGSVTLRYWDHPDGVLLLTDTRPGAEVFQQRLSGVEREVYLFCDTGRTFEQIVAHVRKTHCDAPPDEPSLRRMLDTWLAARIAVQSDNRYLSLALRAPGDS